MQQADFFVCDIFDAVPKGDMASMEHPIFSISTKPDRRIRRYENGQNFVEITPSMKGLATVHDRDVLIYCISQCISALNEEREVSPTIRFRAYDLLKATNRGTDGRGYEQLRAALERLQGTVITTNLITGGKEEFDGFGLIDRFRIVRETRDGRMQEVEIRLSDWVFNAIRHREVLTLHRDYFRLRKPLERRIYELARKHCGAKKEWKIGLAKLQAKCGSCSTEKEFRRLVMSIVRQDARHAHMPDYAVSMENDMVLFTNRRSDQAGTAPPALSHIRLDPEAYHDARVVAPGWDVYVLEQEWREWMTEPPRNPNAAFIGFCKKVFEKRGRP
jgi:plasmid replication initiation protein